LFFPPPEIQTIELLAGRPVEVLRLDLLDPHISGNKWYKLKYNLQRAQKEGRKGLLTFGGANSNHLAATAAACKQMGMSSAAFIRGGEEEGETPTLRFAKEQGMQFIYLSRTDYGKRKESTQLGLWQSDFPNLLLVPEGGANLEGVRGAADILPPVHDFDFICCACGTGTTFMGLLAAAGKASVLGFSVLKGPNTLGEELRILYPDTTASWGGEEVFEAPFPKSHGITNRYASKGYAGFFPPAYEFSAELYQRTGLLLDHVYTSRLFYGVADLMRSGFFSAQARILLIHSGGLQGNSAFEARYGLKSFLV